METPRESLRQALLNTVVASELVPRHRRARLMRWCGIDIPLDTIVFGGQRFRPGRVRFGKIAGINRQCLFDPGDASIEVEDGVGFGPRVIVQAAGHGIGTSGKRASGTVDEPVVIGRGSWIGAGAMILPGVTVAPGCIVGAGAVVVSSTEPDGVYVGVPAKRVRDLPPDGESSRAPVEAGGPPDIIADTAVVRPVAS